MKYNYGFNLISLLVALALGGLIAMGISGMYADLVQSKLHGSNKQLLILRYGTAINQLSNDIKRSGSFGCYNSRIIGNSSYANVKILPTLSILQYQSDKSGLYAFNSTDIPSIDSSVFSNMTLTTGSDILRLQYGSGQANINKVTISNNLLNLLYLEQPQYTHVSGEIISADTPTTYRQETVFSTNSNAPYVLSSCNRLDQLRGSVNTINNTISVATYSIPSDGNLAHDNTSWQLMNFITRYYYVATINGITGLYMTNNLSDGSLGTSTLLTQGVTKITYDFAINDLSGRQIKSRANMAAADWANINNVIINLSIQTTESSGLNREPSTQNIQQSVKIR